jgi:hypothetical protein
MAASAARSRVSRTVRTGTRTAATASRSRPPRRGGEEDGVQQRAREQHRAAAQVAATRPMHGTAATRSRSNRSIERHL